MLSTRRLFCSQAATLLLTPRLLLSQPRSSSHPDVAAIDHDRTLRNAAIALTQPITPITSIPATHSPGSPHDFYSESEDHWPDPANPSDVVGSKLYPEMQRSADRYLPPTLEARDFFTISLPS